MGTAAILVCIQQNLVDYGARILLLSVLRLIVVHGIVLGRAQLGLVLHRPVRVLFDEFAVALRNADHLTATSQHVAGLARLLLHLVLGHVLLPSMHLDWRWVHRLLFHGCVLCRYRRSEHDRLLV